MYNKAHLKCVDDKKILHKVGKCWVVVSITMLSLIGCGLTAQASTKIPGFGRPQLADANHQLQLNFISGGSDQANHSSQLTYRDHSFTKAANNLHNSIINSVTFDQNDNDNSEKNVSQPHESVSLGNSVSHNAGLVSLFTKRTTSAYAHFQNADRTDSSGAKLMQSIVASDQKLSATASSNDRDYFIAESSAAADSATGVHERSLAAVAHSNFDHYRSLTEIGSAVSAQNVANSEIFSAAFAEDRFSGETAKAKSLLSNVDGDTSRASFNYGQISSLMGSLINHNNSSVSSGYSAIMSSCSSQITAANLRAGDCVNQLMSESTDLTSLMNRFSGYSAIASLIANHISFDTDNIPKNNLKARVTMNRAASSVSEYINQLDQSSNQISSASALVDDKNDQVLSTYVGIGSCTSTLRSLLSAPEDRSLSASTESVSTVTFSLATGIRSILSGVRSFGNVTASLKALKLTEVSPLVSEADTAFINVKNASLSANQMSNEQVNHGSLSSSLVNVISGLMADNFAVNQGAQEIRSRVQSSLFNIMATSDVNGVSEAESQAGNERNEILRNKNVLGSLRGLASVNESFGYTDQKIAGSLLINARDAHDGLTMLSAAGAAQSLSDVAQHELATARLAKQSANVASVSVSFLADKITAWSENAKDAVHNVNALAASVSNGLTSLNSMVNYRFASSFADQARKNKLMAASAAASVSAAGISANASVGRTWKAASRNVDLAHSTVASADSARASALTSLEIDDAAVKTFMSGAIYDATRCLGKGEYQGYITEEDHLLSFINSGTDKLMTEVIRPRTAFVSSYASDDDEAQNDALSNKEFSEASTPLLETTESSANPLSVVRGVTVNQSNANVYYQSLLAFRNLFTSMNWDVVKSQASANYISAKSLMNSVASDQCIVEGSTSSSDALAQSSLQNASSEASLDANIDVTELTDVANSSADRVSLLASTDNSMSVNNQDVSYENQELNDLDDEFRDITVEMNIFGSLSEASVGVNSSLDSKAASVEDNDASAVMGCLLSRSRVSPLNSSVRNASLATAGKSVVRITSATPLSTIVKIINSYRSRLASDANVPHLFFTAAPSRIGMGRQVTNTINLRPLGPLSAIHDHDTLVNDERRASGVPDSLDQNAMFMRGVDFCLW